MIAAYAAEEIRERKDGAAAPVPVLGQVLPPRRCHLGAGHTPRTPIGMPLRSHDHLLLMNLCFYAVAIYTLGDRNDLRYLTNHDFLGVGSPKSILLVIVVKE